MRTTGRDESQPACRPRAEPGVDLPSAALAASAPGPQSSVAERAPDNVSAAAPLRVGVLVDSLQQPQWVAKILREIRASSAADICVVIRNAGAVAAAPPSGRLARYWQNRDHLLYALYCRFDDAYCGTPNDAFAPTDIAELVADCPLLDVRPIMKKYSDTFRDDDVERILQHDLDVVVRFGFRILRGRALQIAGHGVWSHHHGDNRVNRGGPAGFWEVMQRDPVSGAVLQILDEDLDNGRAIGRIRAPTIDRFSVRRNKNNFYWKATSLVPNKLRELHERGVRALDGDCHDGPPQPYSHRLYKTPNNAEMASLLGGLCKDYLSRKIDSRLRVDQWMLAYRFRSGRRDGNGSMHKYKYLVPPKDRFWADPFALRFADRYFVLFEEYLYATGRAHISLLELGRDGSVSEPVVVLKQDYHLSYPFVFRWRGDVWMVPESSANGRVELYRGRPDLSEWTLERVLLDRIHAADATLHPIDGRWWMFVCSTMKGLHNWNELHLYHADSPLGPWKPHKRNPVKIDSTNARPAGHLFEANGLFRPAQDCSIRYGYATAFNRILRLSPTDFAEETVSKILPKWDPRVIGTHTYNSADDLTIIDCLTRRGRFGRG